MSRELNYKSYKTKHSLKNAVAKAGLKNVPYSIVDKNVNGFTKFFPVFRVKEQVDMLYIMDELNFLAEMDV
jgi:hypothetical protein